MLTVFLELKEPLTYISRNTEHKEYKSIFFNAKELFILKNIKELFKVFNYYSILIQGEAYITLSHSLIYIYTIYIRLEDIILKF